MSTIVVVKKNGFAVIAADTLTSYGSRRLSVANNAKPGKIVPFGEAYIGVTGSSAHALVLEHLFGSLEQTPQLSSRQEIFDLFRQAHPRLKQEYFLNPREDERAPYESSQMDLLIANRHGIFGCYSLREVFEYDRFWATGSGSDYALGAMHAVYDRELDAPEIAQIGVRAAIDFDEATGPPMMLYSVPLVRSASTSALPFSAIM
jgi:ATP-dependent HslUV protease, peptidase subunit HslV